MSEEDLVEAIRAHRDARYPDRSGTMFTADCELYEKAGVVDMDSKAAYVAAAFDDWREANECRDVLRERGYELLGDWTEHARIAHEQDGLASRAEHIGELPPAYQITAAHSLLRCASTCDLLVLRCASNFHKGFGAIGEFFIAAYEGKECHVIAPPRHSVVFALPNVHVFESYGSWLDHVNSARG